MVNSILDVRETKLNKKDGIEGFKNAIKLLVDNGYEVSANLIRDITSVIDVVFIPTEKVFSITINNGLEKYGVYPRKEDDPTDDHFEWVCGKINDLNQIMFRDKFTNINNFNGGWLPLSEFIGNHSLERIELWKDLAETSITDKKDNSRYNILEIDDRFLEKAKKTYDNSKKHEHTNPFDLQVPQGEFQTKITPIQHVGIIKNAKLVSPNDQGNAILINAVVNEDEEFNNIVYNLKDIETKNKETAKVNTILIDQNKELTEDV